MTKKLALLYLLFVSSVFGFNDNPGEITEQLDNGCTITRQKANTTSHSLM